MGQKVNPHGLRVGIINDWHTQWFAGKKNFGKYLHEDYEIRKVIKGWMPSASDKTKESKFTDCAISSIDIQRLSDSKIVVTIHTGRPGMIIGQKGAGIEEMKKLLSKRFPGKAISINVMEVKHVDMDAQLVSESVAQQIEKRASWRRTMKQAMTRAMKAGAKGVKIMLSGRLDGAEIARCEQYHEGSIPLQTLRADIEYGFATAHTTFGAIGVKVWVYKGQVLKAKPAAKPADKGGNENANA